MRPRLALALSLLVASGAHAVLLLVPHFPGQEEDSIPTVEISLAAGGSGGGGGGGAPLPAAAPSVAAPSRAPIAPPGPPASVPAEEIPAPAPPEQAAPQPDEAETVATVPAPPEAAAAEQGAAPSAVSAGGFGGGTGFTAASGGAGAGTGTGAGSGAGRGGGTGPGTGSGFGTGVGPGAGTDDGAGFHAPRPVADIRPQYPRSARRAGWEGVVRITADIDASGIVTGAMVTSSSGHSVLDDAALVTVRQTLFNPARQDGRTVACRVIIPVKFQLQ